MRLGRRRLNVSRVSFRKIVKGGGVKSEMLMTLGGGGGGGRCTMRCALHTSY